MGNALAFAVAIALVGWAAAMRALAGTWLQPSAFFPLWWCLAGILPLIFAPDEPVGPNAMIWLVAASIAVSVGALAGNWGFRTKRMAIPAAPSIGEIRFFGAVLATTIALGVGSSVAFLAGSSIPLSDVLQLEKLVVVANQLYFQTYAEAGAPPAPVMSRALLPFVYLAPALGGILFVVSRGLGARLCSILSLLPVVMVTVLQTTKAALLFGMVLWFSSYFATRLRFGKLAVFTRTHLFWAAVVAGIVATLFFGVGLARLASTDVSLASVVLLKLVTSAFGHMTVFSQWLAEYTASDFDPTLGKITFAGPLELLGFGQRIPGLFDSIVDLVAGESSNIYTGFRPLIQDFGIPGALIILMLLGLVGGIGFRLVAAGKWIAVPLLLIAYVTILWSPITWFWIYNSLTVAVVSIGVLILAMKLWRGTFPLRSRRSVTTVGHNLST